MNIGLWYTIPSDNLRRQRLASVTSGMSWESPINIELTSGWSIYTYRALVDFVRYRRSISHILLMPDSRILG